VGLIEKLHAFLRQVSLPTVAAPDKLNWRSRRKEDKGYIMTLPTLLPDAIYVLLSTR
jgi:hypothetical protein